LIVEAATGNPVAEELERRIFEPLHLHSTSLGARPRIAGPHAHGYLAIGKAPARDVSVVSPTWAWTAGAVISTADDLAVFYRALLRGRLLGPPLLALMERTVDAQSGLGYGLGIAKAHLPCSAVWGHDGDFPGYLSYAFNSRDGRRQVAVLVNEDSLPPLARDAVTHLLVAAYCG
jgi:D-alanyl-D-alanine carboxypeptidase